MKTTLKQAFFVFAIASCALRPIPGKEGMLTGFVGILDGNCMPSPGQPPCEPAPFQTTLYVTTPSENFDELNVVESVTSNSDGEFSVQLKAGFYSLFIGYQDRYGCSYFECKDLCFCSPFKITADSTTNLNLKLNIADW